jgi:hypothetical protein
MLNLNTSNLIAHLGQVLKRNNFLLQLTISAVLFAGLITSVQAQHAPEILDEPLVEIELPDLGADDRTGSLIAQDLDGDGKKDFVVTRSGIIVAVKTDGTILWQKDTDLQVSYRSEHNGLPGHHGPGVQAYDVTGNGDVEVLYLTRSGELHIANGATGDVIRRVALDSPEGTERWEHLVVGNFRGEGDRDVLLQTTNMDGYRMGRFLAVYAIDELLAEDSPEPLWSRDDFLACAHNGARIADLNGDGRDEIICASIISPDGEKLYEVPLRGAHIDAVQIANVRPDRPGLEVIALEELGPERTFLMGTDGLIWASHNRRIEPQNAAVGTFMANSDEKFVWLRSRFNNHQEPYVFDSAGELVSNYSLNHLSPPDWTRSGIEVMVPIHWSGTGQQYLAAKARKPDRGPGDVAIISALSGEFLYRIPEQADRLYVVDVLGDWREELVVLSGNRLRIYGNLNENPNPNRASLWEQQHYLRTKQTWNYYSP